MWRQKWGYISLMLMLLFAVVLSGCGKDRADITVFVMNETTIPPEVSDSVQAALDEKFKDKFTVDFVVAPGYNYQKLLVEFVAGDKGIIIGPTKDVNNFVYQGGAMPLEKHFDNKKHAEGVLDGLVQVGDGKTTKDVFESHLYTLSSSKLDGMKKLGLKMDGLSAAIPVRTPNFEQSVEVLKMLEQQ